MIAACKLCPLELETFGPGACKNAGAQASKRNPAGSNGEMSIQCSLVSLTPDMYMFFLQDESHNDSKISLNLSAL